MFILGCVIGGIGGLIIGALLGAFVWPMVSAKIGL